MNPIAIIIWMFLACIGFLIGGATGAVSGLAVGLFSSLVAEYLYRKINQTRN